MKKMKTGVIATLITAAAAAGIMSAAQLSQQQPSSRVQTILPAEAEAPGQPVPLRLATERGVLEILPVNADIFRVTVVSPSDTLDYGASQAAILTPVADGVRTIATPDTLLLSSPTTTVAVDRATGRVKFYNADGALLLAEANGVDNSRHESRRATFFGLPGQPLFGAGERGHKLNLNGDTLVMYNRQNYGYTAGDPRISQMNITVPYFASAQGFGVLFDDHTKSTLTLGSDTITYHAPDAVTPLSYYFINGNGSLAGATNRLLELTGRQELPPFWAMGYITSKYGYRTQQETLGVIDTLRTKGYPVDGIVLDLYWYGQETDMGRLEWNRDQWPDPKAMLDSLRSQGVNLVAISQPYINKIGAIDNYNYLTSRGMTVTDSEGRNHDVTTWVGDAGMLDVSNPRTRQWLWQRYDSLTADGIAGWWGDLGEPEVHPATIRHNNGMTAEQYHNVYGNEWSRIIYEGFKEKYPDTRLMLLMRGGTAGLQRYNVFPWSTDVSRSWGGLQPQINIMLNSGLSGMGYMSSDIGGFAVDPEHPVDPELYVRWLQMGAFTPTFRTHAQQKPEPYNYPEQEDILRRFINMRYQWLPYNYTLAWENASKGYPLARPLDFHAESSNPALASIEDEYLWGDNILVAPVLTPGARSRRVTFPAGEWIDLRNPSLTYKGGTTATVKAPLESLPLFVKKGSFLPRYMMPLTSTADYDLSALEVDFFPADDVTGYTLFDDDRRSPGSLTDGNYILTSFSGARDNEGQVWVEICTDKNPQMFDWMPNSRRLTLNLYGLKKAPSALTVETADGTRTLTRAKKAPADADTWTYNSKTGIATATIDFDGSPLVLSTK